MTEKTLAKAIELKGELDKTRATRAFIKSNLDLCSGNYSEVQNRIFKFNILDYGSDVPDAINVSSRAADLALQYEFNEASRVIVDLENKLKNLN